MKDRTFAAAALGFYLGIAPAKADTITFDVTASVTPGRCLFTCALVGNVFINTTIVSIVSANITFTGLPTVGPFDVLAVPTFTTLAGITETGIRDSSFNRLDLFLPSFDLVGYTGGPICNGDTAVCPLVGLSGAGRSFISLSMLGSGLDIASGSLTPVAAVPELSTWATVAIHGRQSRFG